MPTLLSIDKYPNRTTLTTVLTKRNNIGLVNDSVISMYNIHTMSKPSDQKYNLTSTVVSCYSDNDNLVILTTNNKVVILSCYGDTTEKTVMSDQIALYQSKETGKYVCVSKNHNISTFTLKTYTTPVLLFTETSKPENISFLHDNKHMVYTVDSVLHIIDLKTKSSKTTNVREIQKLVCIPNNELIVLSQSDYLYKVKLIENNSLFSVKYSTKTHIIPNMNSIYYTRSRVYLKSRRDVIIWNTKTMSMIKQIKFDHDIVDIHMSFDGDSFYVTMVNGSVCRYRNDTIMSVHTLDTKQGGYILMIDKNGDLKISRYGNTLLFIKDLNITKVVTNDMTNLVVQNKKHRIHINKSTWAYRLVVNKSVYWS